jgi:hypothetical protein
MVKSPITQREYDQKSAIYITNIKQAQLYLMHGAVLLDVLYTDTRTGSLVFVFERSNLLKELYLLWNKHELN